MITKNKEFTSQTAIKKTWKLCVTTSLPLPIKYGSQSLLYRSEQPT